MNKINELYIRRRNSVLLSKTTKGAKAAPKVYLSTMLKNIEDLGYTFSKSLISALSTYSEQNLTSFYQELVPVLKTLKGANVQYKPMYPNFPTQVMEMDEGELYLNALLHYFGDWIGVRIVPKTEVLERLPLVGKYTLTVLTLGTQEEFDSLFTSLVGANSSTSASDKEDVKWFVENYKERVIPLLPEWIPNKENLTFFSGLFLNHLPERKAELNKFFRTATDALRLATALSDGDVSLAKDTKYKSLPRSQRKFLLSVLETSENLEEELFRHRGKWIRLGERLHPGEFKKKFPKTFKAFKSLRTDSPKTQSLNSLIEELLEQKRFQKAATKLVSKPGVFARRLDHLLRSVKTEAESAKVLAKFSKVVNQVSTPVLLQLANHFETRNTKEVRMVMPKGSVAKMQVLKNDLPKLNEELCAKITKKCLTAIERRYSGLPALGKVYVDPALKDFTVPFSQRSASKSLRTVSRGSRFELGKENIVRFFIHWKNLKSDSGNSEWGYDGGRVDLDLSAMMFDADWKLKEQVSYTNLRSATYRAYHSGDITSAPKGAAEFIDLDIESAVKHGARYIVMCVFGYTPQNFDKIPECFAGWMSRKDINSGEIFEPKTVQDRVDLASESTVAVPLVIDLVDRKVIWADLALQGREMLWGNNVHSNKSILTLMGKTLTDVKKPDLYTLFMLHAKARGKVVKNPKKADIVFSVKEGVTPFHIEKIMSDFLT